MCINTFYLLDTNLLLYKTDCNLNRVNNETNHDSNIYLEYNFSNDPELFIPTILVPNL